LSPAASGRNIGAAYRGLQNDPTRSPFLRLNGDIWRRTGQDNSTTHRRPASRTIPFSKSQRRSDAGRSGERERISRLLGRGRLEPFQKLALLLLDHLDGILNCCRTKVPLGVGGSRQREYQVTAASRSWLQEPALSAAEGRAHGCDQNRICGL
jgi:hypothetical protein